MRALLRRLLPCLALLALAAWQGRALAASYAFRADTYAWETTTTAVIWNQGCTSNPVDDDQATINFTGGFSFRFAGTNYSSVRVISNGILQFGADTGLHRAYTNTALPAGSAPTRFGCTAAATARVMMPYWTDLDPRYGSVTWQQKGSAPNRYVVISWNGVYEYQTTTPYTFQVILYENGEFKYQYGNTNATGSNATIGVQVSTSDYTLYSFDSGYQSAGTAIRWGPPNNTPMRVAEYRFEQTAYNGTSGEVIDSTGNGHDGVRVGLAASHATGKVCRGFDVPGNTSSAIAALDTALNVPTGIGDQGGVSFWYRANGAWGTGNDTQLFDASMVSGRSFHLVRRSNGSLRFAVTDSAGATLTADSANQGFAAGTWVHLAATWRLANGSNQSRLDLYVNGVLAGSRTGSTSGTLDQGLGTLFVGDSRNNINSNNATINSADGRFDELRISNFELTAAQVVADRDATRACSGTLHHLELRHASGSALTCNPTTLTVAACADAACSTPYTDGVSGTLSAAGAGMTVNWPAGSAFSIAAGGSTVDVAMHMVTAGSVTLSATATSPSASTAGSCDFGAPSCTFSASDSGLVFDVPHHMAETSQSISVAAVRKSDSGVACVPAFAGVSKSITFSCGYANPASGTLPVRVAGSALNASGNAAAACDAGGRAVTLAFNAAGVASATVQYADVGSVTLAARYSGSGSDAGLMLEGSDGFVAAPASFGFSGISAGPIKAGSAFGATVTARNSVGNATPNFGREAVAEGATLAFTRRQPSGAGASDGSFSGSLGAFAAGSASAVNLVWSEVGRGDLTATLASGNYLGSGLSASGSTGAGGAVGRFIPHHFDVTVTPACGAFSYAGQPFSATVTARNGLAVPTTTRNYDGGGATAPNFAQATSLSDAAALGLGSLSGGAVAASAFSAGVAWATPSYAFTDKQTAPLTLTLRAADVDAVSSAGHVEAGMPLRSGRLRIASAYGAQAAPLQLRVLAEHWSGQAWVLNTADSCTALPASSVARSNQRDARGAATAAWSNTVSAITISAGAGTLTLGAPSPAGSGSLDLALNLGSTAADQSCLAAHPASTGAGLPWLRSRQGACAATWDRDPSARASFGIFSPEGRKTVHARELF
jgi:MSHA biogenesis protein MshQ